MSSPVAQAIETISYRTRIKKNHFYTVFSDIRGEVSVTTLGDNNELGVYVSDNLNNFNDHERNRGTLGFQGSVDRFIYFSRGQIVINEYSPPDIVNSIDLVSRPVSIEENFIETYNHYIPESTSKSPHPLCSYIQENIDLYNQLSSKTKDDGTSVLNEKKDYLGRKYSCDNGTISTPAGGVGVKNPEDINLERENPENLENIIKNRVWGDFPIENQEDNLAKPSICFHKYAY